MIDYEKLRLQVQAHPYPLVFATISGAHLRRLNEAARLSSVDDLIARKLAGPEKSHLPETDLRCYETEYRHLAAALESASATSRLPEAPRGKEALNDLLVPYIIPQKVNR